MKRKSASRQADTIAKYRELLAEEEKFADEKDEGAKGRPKEPRRRALERLAEMTGYTNWRSAESVVKRWERTRRADIETWGMDLDDEFSAAIRLLQDSVDSMRGACINIEEGMRSLGMEPSQELKVVFKDLDEERPNYLCPFCKATTDECALCLGNGWISQLGNVDRRLTGAVVHVERDGKIVKLEDLK